MKPGAFDPDDDALLDRFEEAGQDMCRGCAEDARQTITVGALIEALRTYDPTLPVWITWEGISRHLNTDHLYEEDGTLMIDGDENHYAPERRAGRAPKVVP